MKAATGGGEVEKVVDPGGGMVGGGRWVGRRRWRKVGH